MTVIIMFVLLRYKETHGHWPLMKSKLAHTDFGPGSGVRSDVGSESDVEKKGEIVTAKATEVK
jgi:hypothetical protein